MRRNFGFLLAFGMKLLAAIFVEFVVFSALRTELNVSLVCCLINL